MSHKVILAAPAAIRPFPPTPAPLEAHQDRFSEEIQRILSPQLDGPASHREDGLPAEFRELDFERCSISPLRQLEEQNTFDLSEEILARTPSPELVDKVKKLSNTIFYSPPLEKESSDVIFVAFWERRGTFHYQEVYESCQSSCIDPFELAVEFSGFQQRVKLEKEPVVGGNEAEECIVITPFEHDPAIKFLEKNLNDLREALKYLRQNQINMDYQFFQTFNTVANSINRLAQTSLEASGRDVRLQERKNLQMVVRQLSRSLNSTDQGLLAQHEIIQRRHEGFQIFTKAVMELESGVDKPVLCPSLFRPETLQYTRASGKHADLPAKNLAEFYDAYENLLVAHRAYFTQAICAHRQLIIASKDLIKEIDAGLQLG
ncbi:MAG: hypothetical protein KF898_10415 [Parachlamydiales bacterium]|nr:hypothetical protein [Candidatus Acheromyda pituitae]